MNKLNKILLTILITMIILTIAIVAFGADTAVNLVSSQTDEKQSVLILFAIAFEVLARIFPTKYDFSLLSNILRLFDKFLPNKYKEQLQDGTIKKGWFKVRRKLDEAK